MRRTARLVRRLHADFVFLDSMKETPDLLLDTTVYIDELQAKFTPRLEYALQGARIWHSSVTECELTAVTGLLDPAHAGSAEVLRRVAGILEKRHKTRTVIPDREVWHQAGILSGTLARLQQYGKADQRKVLNDALILLSAAKAGLTVLTRNIEDFDLLTQLAPHARVAFYDVER